MPCVEREISVFCPAMDRTGAADGAARPITIAIVAMGGQGGGVLADWIVAVAEENGWHAQSTSVPGVAQRTGATLYYIEMLPPRDGWAPVLALMPTPGDVDVVIAAELMEAGRSILRVGVMTPFFLSPFIGALAWTLLLQRDVGPLNLLLIQLGLAQIQPYSIQMIIFVMGLYYAPYMFIFVASALHNIDPSLEEAGHLSGLSRRQIMIRITLPLVAPAILSGLLLTFVASAGQFGVPALLCAVLATLTALGMWRLMRVDQPGAAA